MSQEAIKSIMTEELCPDTFSFSVIKERKSRRRVLLAMKLDDDSRRNGRDSNECVFNASEIFEFLLFMSESSPTVQ